MREIILISFLGPDQPNQFTRLMQVLSVHSLQILDVGQAVIHNQLTLGIVVASDNETATALAMKEILILAHDIGLTVRFKPITGAEYDQWVSEGGRTRYIVTALAPELTLHRSFSNFSNLSAYPCFNRQLINHFLLN